MHGRMAKWSLLLIGASLCLWVVVSQAIQDTTAFANQPVREQPGAASDQNGGAAGAVPESPASDFALSDDVTEQAEVAWPLFILAVGVVIVLGLIIGMKVNAFLALITAAMVVSLLAEGVLADKIARVAVAFGEAAGEIGIVIALAAVIGKCMLDSGAADRIVQGLLRLFGQKRAPMALMGSGFFLAIPVFFDTVFYLLVPLARSLHRKTGLHYLLYVLAIAVGGAITHTLVPPTPGPLIMATQLEFDWGVMMLTGIIVALPAALAGLGFAMLIDRLMPVPMRRIGTAPEPKALEESELPPLALSVAPVLLPVLLILGNSVFKVFALSETSPSWLHTVQGLVAVVGNPNLALLFSAVIALLTLFWQRRLTREQLSQAIETSLMSGGVIILITSSGGAFGEMLKTARVGAAIEQLFSNAGGAGLVLLLLAFTVSAVLKIAQGSSTVAMITGSAMLADVATSGSLSFHPVYLATAIGTGSLMGSWMNDSGFWIFAKMSGLTETEALKSWTLALATLALAGLAATLLLATVLPYPPLTTPP
ncbi:MAG: GntP family permease [Planctomycetota bacterium]